MSQESEPDSRVRRFWNTCVGTCKRLLFTTNPTTYGDQYKEAKEDFMKAREIRGGRVTAPESREIVANGGRGDEPFTRGGSDDGISERARARIDEVENETEDNKQMIWENRILLRVIDERTANLAKIIVGLLITVLGGIILTFVTGGL